VNDFEEALVHRLFPFRHAMTTMVAVLDRGQLAHPANDGFRQSVSFHTQRAMHHLELLQAGDVTERHLENACCRLLLALEVERS
jgi:hypothetical protein